ncbi:MAG: hypothetical protein HY271_09810 [Deltaproteobacteria bacterium]|nr:hypothetical protein [Deltaproteobacteria bacterium]
MRLEAARGRRTFALARLFLGVADFWDALPLGVRLVRRFFPLRRAIGFAAVSCPGLEELSLPASRFSSELFSLFAIILSSAPVRAVAARLS